jgi:Icc-related predicted phosphoesterase
MKILVTSDLHVDFAHKVKLNWTLEEEYDLLIVAGDIANTTRGVETYMRHLATQVKELLWISGNHCFWSQDRAFCVLNPSASPDKKTIQEAQNGYARISGYMNRTIKEVQGHRILGCTLWYDTPGRQNWSDHQEIIDWWMIEEEAKEDKQWLEDNLREGDIVVTHMLPSWECVSPQYVGETSNRYYVHDVHKLIIEKKPKLWISGHSHERMVKTIGSTLYVRNPRGYNSENPNYSHLIVDTDKIGEYDAVWDVGFYNSHVGIKKVLPTWAVNLRKDVENAVKNDDNNKAD